MFFAVKKVLLDIEWTISCEKSQICSFTIFPVVQCVFYRSCSRKPFKGFGGFWSSANRCFGFGSQHSDGATCIIFCMSDRNLSATNWNFFPLLEQIKPMDRILLMFPVTICSVFCYRKEIRVLKILFRVSCLSIILMLTILLRRKGQWYCFFTNDDFSFNKLFSFLKIIRNFSTLKQTVWLKL